MNKKQYQENEQLKEQEMSFFEKCKADKKYKAKIELIGYGVFILVLIFYLNIVGAGKTSGNFQNMIIKDNGQEESDNDVVTLEKSDLLKEIKDNYEYDIRVSFKSLEENKELESIVHYFGKRYQDEVVIEKEFVEENNTYYKSGSIYYGEVENKYELLEEDVVYNVLEKEYIEFDFVREYLKIASLDHVTDYSSGKKEYVYHLKVRDIVKTYTGNDEVEFSLESFDGVLSMKVDYANLLKVMDEDVLACNVEYIFKNIGNIEEFQVIDNDMNLEYNHLDKNVNDVE